MLKERLIELHRKLEIENEKKKKLQKIWDKLVVGAACLTVVAFAVYIVNKIIG